jgi:hypothetical protein
VLDIRVRVREYARKMKHEGFEVHAKSNWQARAGWLTGLRVPHDTKNLSPIVNLALYALEENRL